jgi:uncharacterized UBP type Zn finger protein
LFEKIEKIVCPRDTKNLLINPNNQQALQYQQRARRLMAPDENTENINQHYEETIQQITQMGFTRQQAEQALYNIIVPDVALAVDWITNNPIPGGQD